MKKSAGQVPPKKLFHGDPARAVQLKRQVTSASEF